MFCPALHHWERFPSGLSAFPDWSCRIEDALPRRNSAGVPLGLLYTGCTGYGSGSGLL